MKNVELIPVKYYVNDDIYLENRDPENKHTNKPSWAITKRGRCLNRMAEWEYEPFPSSRDDDYLARNRFSFEDARHFLKHYMSGNIL